MSEIVAPNLIFPGLDFRLQPEPEPDPPPEQSAEPTARERRREFRANLRDDAIKPPRPQIGAFTVLDLDDEVCHWPFGERPYLFCGAGTKAAPYCSHHARMAFNP